MSAATCSATTQHLLSYPRKVIYDDASVAISCTKETINPDNLINTLKKRRLTYAAVLGLAMLAAASAQAQTLTILYNFVGAPNGYEPYGKLLIVGSSLYGMTLNGGNVQYGGTVFELNNQNSEVVLHSFTGSPDGTRNNFQLAGQPPAFG